MNLTLGLSTLSDLPELIQVFNRAHAGYAGFAERSVEDFRWRYLDRSDIGTDGVIVVNDVQRGVVGYVVVGASGTIWEWAIDPDAERRPVAELMIAAAEQRLAERGVDEIVLHAPVDDEDMAAALQAAGYGARPPIQQYLSFIDLPSVVERVLRKHGGALPPGLTAVEFAIRNPRPWHPERFTATFGERSSASRKRSPCRSKRLSKALVGVMVGSDNPRKVVATGSVRITPVSKTVSGLKVLSALRLRTPFFFTPGDVI